ncbi:hypothetical protein B0H17DRAFT_1151004 [Mycena rosella]|uniref:Uncharacterized protein n=1 Tax=Mycena rosella TaxID=1033263 RepID=A0AAD7BNU8_MYCRO|nr:hypothetical protein B0H17DRAFT_1151004 [Mycena rosella]
MPDNCLAEQLKPVMLMTVWLDFAKVSGAPMRLDKQIRPARANFNPTPTPVGDGWRPNMRAPFKQCLQNIPSGTVMWMSDSGGLAREGWSGPNQRLLVAVKNVLELLGKSWGNSTKKLGELALHQEKVGGNQHSPNFFWPLKVALKGGEYQKDT